MKKTMMMAALALMLTTTASFAAVSKGEWTGGGQAGLHIPSGDYGDLAKAGYVLGVFLDYNLTPMFSLGTNLDFNSTKAKDEIVKSTGADEIKFTLFNYGVNGALAFMPEAVVHPYVKAGLGMYNMKTEVKGSGLSADDTTNKLGFLGGAGLRIHPAGKPLGFGIEGLIHNVADAIEETNGSKKSAQFFTVTGRLTFSFSDASQK